MNRKWLKEGEKNKGECVWVGGSEEGAEARDLLDKLAERLTEPAACFVAPQLQLWTEKKQGGN